ncbi:MAG TPA: cell division protein ZapA [Candidatus Binataceae bacterium]|nr:cell division protein ZapA [Candidatus Binataceae bacterium]
MKAVNVEIMGLNLTVASEDGDEWVKNLAQTVDQRIRQIQAGGRTVNSINLAILAALNFADELERLRKDHRELIERIEALNGRLSDAMEE